MEPNFKNVLDQLDVDYCLPLSEIGGLLYKLIPEKTGKQKAVPKDILIETKIAKRVLSDLPSVNALGDIRYLLIVPAVVGSYGKWTRVHLCDTVVILAMRILLHPCLLNRR